MTFSSGTSIQILYIDKSITITQTAIEAVLFPELIKLTYNNLRKHFNGLTDDIAVAVVPIPKIFVPFHNLHTKTWKHKAQVHKNTRVILGKYKLTLFKAWFYLC